MWDFCVEVIADFASFDKNNFISHCTICKKEFYVFIIIVIKIIISWEKTVSANLNMLIYTSCLCALFQVPHPHPNARIPKKRTTQYSFELMWSLIPRIKNFMFCNLQGTTYRAYNKAHIHTFSKLHDCDCNRQLKHAWHLWLILICSNSSLTDATSVILNLRAPL